MERRVFGLPAAAFVGLGAVGVGVGVGRLVEAGVGEALAPQGWRFFPWLFAELAWRGVAGPALVAVCLVYGCVALSGIVAALFARLAGVRAKLPLIAAAASLGDALVVSPLNAPYALGLAAALLWTVGAVAVSVAFGYVIRASAGDRVGRTR